LQHVSGLATLSGTGLIAGDVDEDGTASIADGIIILKHVAGISSIDTFNMVDSNNNKITSVDMLNATPEWSLIANGDLDMSGGFLDIA